MWGARGPGPGGPALNPPLISPSILPKLWHRIYHGGIYYGSYEFLIVWIFSFIRGYISFFIKDLPERKSSQPVFTSSFHTSLANPGLEPSCHPARRVPFSEQYASERPFSRSSGCIPCQQHARASKNLQVLHQGMSIKIRHSSIKYALQTPRPNCSCMPTVTVIELQGRR